MMIAHGRTMHEGFFPGSAMWNRLKSKASDSSIHQGRERHHGYDTANDDHHHFDLHRGLKGWPLLRLLFFLHKKARLTPRFFNGSTHRFIMISIQLPDGSKREFPGPVTIAEVAAS